MNNKRDYNVEIKDTNDHKYAYGFDFDVMHPYMIKSFEPFFNQGSLLELGSFKGDFTSRFLPYFNDITCVEASDVAVAEAKKKLGDKVKFVNSLFEQATLPKHYDNIVLTHVLEHLDDPVLVLKRINDEWLAEGGRFFLVCPNANAPSRQIAVKMGLISHNSAVTPAEAEHGHRCTYTLDTLERDAVAAGLRVMHRSGISSRRWRISSGIGCCKRTSFLKNIWRVVISWGSIIRICVRVSSLCANEVIKCD